MALLKKAEAINKSELLFSKKYYIMNIKKEGADLWNTK